MVFDSARDYTYLEAPPILSAVAVRAELRMNQSIEVEHAPPSGGVHLSYFKPSADSAPAQVPTSGGAVPAAMNIPGPWSSNSELEAFVSSAAVIPLLGARVLLLDSDMDRNFAIADLLQGIGVATTSSEPVSPERTGVLPGDFDAVLVQAEQATEEICNWVSEFRSAVDACASLVLTGPGCDEQQCAHLAAAGAYALRFGDCGLMPLLDAVAGTICCTKSWRAAGARAHRGAELRVQIDQQRSLLRRHDLNQVGVQRRELKQAFDPRDPAVQRVAQLAEAWQLTQAEARVLHAIANGRPYRKAGQLLGISERTVQFHATNIYAKLQLDGRRSFSAFLATCLAAPDGPHVGASL